MADLNITNVSSSHNAVTEISVGVPNAAVVSAVTGYQELLTSVEFWPLTFPTAVLKGGLKTDSSSTATFRILTDAISPTMQFFRPRDGMVSNLGVGFGALEPALHNPVITDHGNSSSLHSFKNDWYNRIHLIPLRIDLGNLLSEVTRSFQVWNAYFVLKTLNDVVPTNAEGLTLTSPVSEPYGFRPLEELTYEVAISTTGPAVVDATFDFEFDGPETVTLQVTGSRVVVFPYEPDWGNHIKERIEWLSDVITSYDGTETRTRLRQIPRKVYEFEILLNKEDKNSFDSLISNWLYRPFALPIWTDASTLTAPYTAEGLVLEADTTDRDYVVGESVFVGYGKDFETTEIESFTSSTITLERPLAKNWPLGSNMCPVKITRLPENVTASFITRHTDTVRVRFMVDKPTDLTPTDFDETYRSSPLLMEEPRYSGELRDDYKAKIQVVDNKVSQTSVEIESPYIKSTTEYIWLPNSKAKIRAMKDWLHARYGKQKAVWIPTWNNDMVVYDETLSGSSVINIKNIGFTRFLIDKINRRDIVIWYNDGSYATFRINSSIDNDDYEQIVLDATVPQNTSPSTVLRISYLEHKRMESDAVELNWITPEVVKLQHKMVSVLDDLQ